MKPGYVTTPGKQEIFITMERLKFICTKEIQG